MQSARQPLSQLWAGAGCLLPIPLLPAPGEFGASSQASGYCIFVARPAVN